MKTEIESEVDGDEEKSVVNTGVGNEKWQAKKNKCVCILYFVCVFYTNTQWITMQKRHSDSGHLVAYVRQ